MSELKREKRKVPFASFLEKAESHLRGELRWKVGRG